ncbi:hypothetical protein WJX77_006205 [Trebouxia sp. C0004]
MARAFSPRIKIIKEGSHSDDMEAALPAEETAAASALVSMNTSPAASPRPAAAVLEAEVPLPAQVQGGATIMHTLQQMSSEIRSVKTAMAKMHEHNDSHVVLAHMIGQQSNLIRGATGMTCDVYRADLSKAVRDCMKKEETHKKKQLAKQHQAVKARQQALQDKAQQQRTSAAQADSAANSGDTEEADFVTAAEAALPDTAAAASSPDTAEDMHANEALDGSPVEMPEYDSLH